MTTTTLLDPAHQPPHDLAAEETVAASVLVDVGLAARLVGVVRREDFHDLRCAAVFAAAQAVAAKGEPPTEVLVAAELSARHELQSIGGPAYLSELTTALPTTVGADYCAQLVARLAVSSLRYA